MAILQSVITAVGAAAAAVTATVPAPPSGQRTRVTFIEVVLYNTVARVGSATPVTVTTTGLGGLTMTFPSAGAVGTCERREYVLENPIDNGAQATAATVVCPATTSVMWRINLIYRNEET